MDRYPFTLTRFFFICSGILAAVPFAFEPVETTYFNGSIHERFFITRTKQGGSFKDSLYTEFYQNGKKKRVVSYRDNRETGKAYTWYETGAKESECIYENGELEGVKKVWFPGGKLKSRSSWRRGVLDGKSESWFENGSPRTLAYFDNGKSSDEYRTWYENGRPRSRSYYKKGVPCGVVRGWHKNGGQAITGFYNNEGQSEGLWQIFGEEGNKCADIEYVNGEAIKKRFFAPDSTINEIFETISTLK